jgi:iron complex transport system ATP-binding protein
MAKLEFLAVSVKVRDRTLLDAVNLGVRDNDFVALVGPNGAGKTTLLKCALALRVPTSGSVCLQGEPVHALDARARAAKLAWLPQHIRAEEPLSALDTVAAARFRFRESPAQSRLAAERALRRVGALEYERRAVSELSGGERQRVAFACLLAQEASTLLFDEPANHLDPAQQLEVYGLLGELWREGRTIVCINHDVNLLNHLGEPERVRVVGLRAGRLAFEARLSEPDLPARLGALFGVEMDSVRGAEQRYILPRARSRA